MTDVPSPIRLPLHTRVLLALVSPIGALLRRMGYDPFAERCSWCRRDLPVGEAFYVEGRRVCSSCADAARRRITRAAMAFLVLTLIMMLAAGYGAVQVIRRDDPDAWIAIPILALSAAFPLGCLWFSLRAMKAANKHIDREEQTLALMQTLRGFRPSDADHVP